MARPTAQLAPVDELPRANYPTRSYFVFLAVDGIIRFQRGFQITFALRHGLDELALLRRGCVSAVVEEGDPKTRIIDHAAHWQADVIVLGSHGRKGLDRFLLGSVSEAVARHAPCSVENCAVTRAGGGCRASRLRRRVPFGLQETAREEESMRGSLSRFPSLHRNSSDAQDFAWPRAGAQGFLRVSFCLSAF